MFRNRKAESYVEGTQRGYAYGLKLDGERYFESYVHPANWSTQAITRAYREASNKAAVLLYTWRKRPKLVKKNI